MAVGALRNVILEDKKMTPSLGQTRLAADVRLRSELLVPSQLLSSVR